MTAAEARRRFASAAVARLATADAQGRPHLVPIVFALRNDVVWSAVDAKPKRTRALRRLANIAANPAVCVLVDHYEDDWTRLWWVRADGRARILEATAPDAAVGLDALAARYASYRDMPPPGPLLEVSVERWSGWSSG